jgi:hypothetical protein
MPLTAPMQERQCGIVSMRRNKSVSAADVISANGRPALCPPRIISNTNRTANSPVAARPKTLSDRQIDTFSDALLALFMVLLLPPNQQKGKHA